MSERASIRCFHSFECPKLVCRRHTCQKTKYLISESSNVFQKHAKHFIILSPLLYLLLYVSVWRANLAIVKELGDRAAQGRTYGNLGNSHYLLGNFQDAVLAHEQVFHTESFWMKLLVLMLLVLVVSIKMHKLKMMGKKLL